MFCKNNRSFARNFHRNAPPSSFAPCLVVDTALVNEKPRVRSASRHAPRVQNRANSDLFFSFAGVLRSDKIDKEQNARKMRVGNIQKGGEGET